MKAIPLPFEDFQGKGVLNFSSAASSPDSYPRIHHHLPLQKQQLHKWRANSNGKDNCCYLGTEPTSVLESTKHSSPPTSSSTLSSSQGGGGGGGGGGASTDTTTTGVVTEKCGGGQLGMEDWESVLSGSPSQEQSIMRLIMGDVEDPALGFNKLLQTTGCNQEMELNAGFGVVDQVFGFEVPSMNSTSSSTNFVNNSSSSSSCNIDPSSLRVTSSSSPPDFPLITHNGSRIGSVLTQNTNPNLVLSTSAANLFPGMFQHHPIEATDEKPQILNPQLIMNQQKAPPFGQNQAMFLPLTYAHQHQLQDQHHHHHLLSSPPAPPPLKRLNSGGPIGANFPHQQQVPKMQPFSADSSPDLFLQRQQQMLEQQQQQQQGRPSAAMLKQQKVASDELAIINPICQAAELIETGNPVLAQGILARLNHQLSIPIGKPYHRAAFYFKEALQLLLNLGTGNSTTTSMSSCNLILKIGAYKSFSEMSPILQFANFTCNQALLEAFEGYDRIHIIDFDIGYGGQWASLMQELALRNGGAPSLKITAFASPSSHDELDLSFTHDNLRIFAGEINMPFELEILGLDSLNSGPWPIPLGTFEKDVIAVNLPIGCFSNYPSTLPLVLSFVKQLSPKIVVSLDRGCDRTDLPFAHHVNHAIQSYSTLLESLDAVSMHLDALQKIDLDFLQKIERFLILPGIEKIILGRQRCPERTLPWRSLFLQAGFTPLMFSNFTESQAEYLVQRTPVRGFHVEKRQSSLVLFWQRKELISASAWRC